MPIAAQVFGIRALNAMSLWEISHGWEILAVMLSDLALRAIWSESVRIAPPPPVVTILLLLKLRIDTAPNEPHGLPPTLEPSASAASSMMGMLPITDAISLIWHGLPRTWTGTIAAMRWPLIVLPFLALRSRNRRSLC